MAKRKPRPKPDPPTADQVAKSHLTLAEQMGIELPTINGIPVTLVLSYDMLRFINEVAVIDAQNTK